MTEPTNAELAAFHAALGETLATLFALATPHYIAGEHATNIRQVDGDWWEAYLVNVADSTPIEGGHVGKFRMDTVRERAAEIAARRT